MAGITYQSPANAIQRGCYGAHLLNKVLDRVFASLSLHASSLAHRPRATPPLTL